MVSLLLFLTWEPEDSTSKPPALSSACICSASSSSHSLKAHLQIACASRYTSALLEAVGRVTALVLAKHKVLVDILAVLADEEARGLERCRRHTELVNVWLARRHGSRVDVGFPWELGISVCGHFGAYATA